MNEKNSSENERQLNTKNVFLVLLNTYVFWCERENSKSNRSELTGCLYDVSFEHMHYHHQPMNKDYSHTNANDAWKFTGNVRKQQLSPTPSSACIHVCVCVYLNVYVGEWMSEWVSERTLIIAKATKWHLCVVFICGKIFIDRRLLYEHIQSSKLIKVPTTFRVWL